MTSRIGNDAAAFTFVEVMVTLVVLSSGLVFLYRSFFLCSDALTRLSLRLDALQLLDNKTSEIQRYVRENHDLSFSRFGMLPVEGFNDQRTIFSYRTDLVPVVGNEGLYSLHVRLTWQERGVERHLDHLSMLEMG